MADLQSRWHVYLRATARATKDYAIDQFSRSDIRKFFQELKQQIHKTFTVPKTVAATLVLSMSTLGAIEITEAIKKTDLYYKVFIDGQYVGVVKDPRIVNDKIVTLGDRIAVEVSMVPVRQRINDEPSEAAVSLALNEAANPKIRAVVIRVNGRDAVTVKDMTSAKKVIDSVKAKFASADNPVKEVKTNQKIDFLTRSVNRDEVRSVNEAVQLFLDGSEKPKKYLVSRGDTLWSIAARNTVSIDKLKAANPQITDENSLQEGQEILINTVEPLVTVETVAETTRTVPYDFQTIYRDDATMNKGEQRVITEGQVGEKIQRLQIRKKNDKVYEEVVLSEQITKEKVDKVVLRGTKVNITPRSGDWVWPVGSRTITSPYGEKRGSQTHPAMDIGAPTGNPVYASNNGTVIYAGWDGGYGKTIRISHGNGIVSTYAHLSSINVSVGQNVTKGDRIGGVGSTGNSTGPHLHYEVRVNGFVVNPAPYM